MGVRNLAGEPVVAALLQEAADRDIWIAAICAAPTLLAKTGCLRGKRAVCYPGMEGQLTGAVPCPEEPVVVDGKLITARAAGAAFDFGLALVEALAGKEKAAEVRRGVCY